MKRTLYRMIMIPLMFTWMVTMVHKTEIYHVLRLLKVKEGDQKMITETVCDSPRFLIILYIFI